MGEQALYYRLPLSAVRVSGTVKRMQDTTSRRTPRSRRSAWS